MNTTNKLVFVLALIGIVFLGGCLGPSQSTPTGQVALSAGDSDDTQNIAVTGPTIEVKMPPEKGLLSCSFDEKGIREELTRFGVTYIYKYYIPASFTNHSSFTAQNVVVKIEKLELEGLPADQEFEIGSIPVGGTVSKTLEWIPNGQKWADARITVTAPGFDATGCNTTLSY